jgi:DME family drug/metabolite transporter
VTASAQAAPAAGRPSALAGIGWTVAAAALFGTIGTARALGPDSSSLSVGAIRLLIAGTILVVGALVTVGGAAVAVALRRPEVWVAAVTQGLFQITFLTAVPITGVVVSTLVAIGSAPVFAGLLARTRSRPWLVATTLAVVGVLLLSLGHGDTTVDLRGVWLSLGAGVSYAVYVAATRRSVLAGVPGPAFTAAVFALAGLMLAPALAFTENGWAATASGATMVVYLALVPTTIAYLLLARGLRSIPAPHAQTVALAEPLVATALGIVVVGESLAPIGVLGGAFVVGGLGVLALADAKGESHS